MVASARNIGQPVADRSEAGPGNAVRPADRRSTRKGRSHPAACFSAAGALAQAASSIGVSTVATADSRTSAAMRSTSASASAG